MKNNAYAVLEQRFAEIGKLDYICALIGWDARVCAPDAATADQGDQMAELAKRRHEILTRGDWDDLFDRLENDENLNDWQRANVREAKDWHMQENALTDDLVARSAVASNRGQSVWAKAKAENDFKAFAPCLKELVAVARETAALVGEKTKTAPYDALLGLFQPGTNVEKLDVLFAELKDFLPDFIENVRLRQKKAPDPFKNVYPAERQTAFCKELMRTMGFDFSRGRLDMSDSAFQTGCGRDDARVVGRLSETDPLRAVAAVMHETGHALYEQGLPREFALQPVGKARGMAAHESQSLLMTGCVLQNEAFLRRLAEKMTRFYKTDECSFDRLKRILRRVEPSLIRIDADDATYPLHVILRYELEKDLIGGALDVDDLPDAWNVKMREYLGVVPRTDAEGCLQDIHWAAGSFGYFPDYTVGAVAAAQFFAAARKAVPDMDARLGAGDFSALKSWLDENVHAFGSKLSFDELTRRATGTELSARAFKDALRERYGV